MTNKPKGKIEEKSVERTKEAVDRAIAEIHTPEDAARVIDEVERAAGQAAEHEVAEHTPTPTSAEEAAEKIEKATEAPPEERPRSVLLEAAQQIAAAEEEDEELLAEGVHEATNPEALAMAQPETEQGRRLLREELLHRLKPLKAADTAVFLAINQMPHTPELNSLMHTLTTIMNRGDGWVLVLLFAAARNHQRGTRALIDVLPALWLATATVEYPIKTFFRRRRPFISLVRAVVVGKKPGSYSFPSGHSASAFAGAWLVSRHFPGWAPLCYALASLVAFSRIYLGVHYPSDVISGASSGLALAVFYRWLAERIREGD